ncbi:MAG: Hpt domain-containing protein [Proteobacteria bacterium]|nr:Hpt domain-containing protein [Pseudomonadota bacterium]
MEKGVFPDASLPVDITVMRRMFHDNSALVRKFGLKFIEVATDTLVEMKAAQVEKNLQELGRLGHKLKSSARTIGAASFADLCEALEKASVDNRWSDAESLIAEISPLLERITQQLENEFSKMGE